MKDCLNRKREIICKLFFDVQYIPWWELRTSGLLHDQSSVELETGKFDARRVYVPTDDLVKSAFEMIWWSARRSDQMNPVLRKGIAQEFTIVVVPPFRILIFGIFQFSKLLIYILSLEGGFFKKTILVPKVNTHLKQ